MNTHLRRVCLSFLALLLPLLFISASATTRAAPPPPQTLAELKAKWWSERDPATLPPLVLSAAVAAAASAPTAGDALADVSRIAYQSLRTGAWEVFLARGDGTQSQRLTNGGENTTPSLNRGATHVAFTSRRDGDQEIYSMRADGAELRRLTASGGDDSWAAWSPDSRRIAFASTRNFSWDIFVMNVDGTGQTRLTSTANDEISPAWSPDGQQIAWVQRDGDQGTLMLMNADGSQARVLVSSMRYLENPRWSPNGAYIAFDADVDNDSWTEVVTYCFATAARCRVYDAWQNGVDVWMGSWSPDGEYMAINRIDYGVSNGELIITNSFIQRIGRIATTGSSQNLLSSGYDFFPSWQATDIAPPATRLQPLPRYVKVDVGRALTIMWEGWDDGPAGVSEYWPQLWKEPGGGWQALPSTTQTWTNLLWQGDSAHTYAFRVRARDHAGNFGAWSGDSDDLFTPYIWRLDGRVHDSRGVDLDDAMVQRTPDTPDPATTTPDGRFQVHVTRYTQPTLVSVAKEGYFQAPAQPFSSLNNYANRRYWWALRPEANRIEGGDFEAGSLSSWSISGTAPTVLDQKNPYQGVSSASMGQPADPPISRLSEIDPNGTDLYSPPRMARDALANLHVVWAESGGAEDGVYYARIEQTVDLNELHAPTLSFAYKLAATVDEEASLSATIDGVTVFSTTHPTAEWSHGWADLSPWAGQTVVIGFVSQSTAASGPILVNIDAVSVSSWLTPIIRSIAPSYLPPQTAIPITLHGENFVAPVSLFVNSAPLTVHRPDEQTLTATLPATLLPGSYDVQVRNAVGQSYTLRGGLRIGRQVFLPALLLSHERGASEP